MPYFKQIIAGQSSAENIIYVSENNFPAFSQVVSFLCTGRISISITPARRTRNERKKSARHLPKTKEPKSTKLLLRTYILADEIGVEALANKLIGLFKLARQNFPVSGFHLKYLVDHGMRTSKLFDFMLEQVAFDIWNHGGMKECRFIFPDLFTDFVDVSKENSQILREKSLILDRDASEISPAQRWLNCAWHTHETTPMCEESEGEEEGYEFNENGCPLKGALDSKAEELKVKKRRGFDEFWC